jgi:hypothetical protein
MPSVAVVDHPPPTGGHKIRHRVHLGEGEVADLFGGSDLVSRIVEDPTMSLARVLAVGQGGGVVMPLWAHTRGWKGEQGVPFPAGCVSIGLG